MRATGHAKSLGVKPRLRKIFVENTKICWLLSSNLNITSWAKTVTSTRRHHADVNVTRPRWSLMKTADSFECRNATGYLFYRPKVSVQMIPSGYIPKLRLSVAPALNRTRIHSVLLEIAAKWSAVFPSLSVTFTSLLEKGKKISKRKKYNYEHAMGQINKLIKNNY